MGTTYGNPYWDKPSESKPPGDPWYMWPMSWVYMAIAFFVVVYAFAAGVLIQTLFGIFCLLIATGKIKIRDMETEWPDDPEFK